MQNVQPFKKSDYFSDEFTDILEKYVSSKTNTRSACEYWGNIRILCDTLQKDFLAIEPSDAQTFFSYMAQRVKQGTIKKATVNIRKSNYNTLANHIVENYPEYDFVNPFSVLIPYELNTSIPPSSIPSLSEIDAFLAATQGNMMYHLIFCLAFRMALTASELISLRLQNVQVVDGRRCIHLPANSDFEKDRILFLPEDIDCLVVRYLDTLVFHDADGHLFYNKYRNPLTLRNLDKAVQKYMKLAGIDAHYTLKDLRSRAILDMVSAAQKNGTPVGAVADFVGLQGLRLNTYVSASDVTQMDKENPASYVSIRVKTDKDK